MAIAFFPLPVTPSLPTFLDRLSLKLFRCPSQQQQVLWTTTGSSFNTPKGCNLLSAGSVASFVSSPACSPHLLNCGALICLGRSKPPSGHRHKHSNLSIDVTASAIEEQSPSQQDSSMILSYSGYFVYLTPDVATSRLTLRAFL